MILNCPSCGTRYHVDPAALGVDGQRVRCARCRHVWVERQPEDMPKRVDLSEPFEAPQAIFKRPGRPPAAERSRSVDWVGWLMLAVVVGALVGGGVFAREHIVAAWPPAAKLYDMVRLPVSTPGSGLELRNVRSSQTLEEGVLVLLVEGEIVNVSAAARTVPRLRVTLRDDSGHEIDHWLISAASPGLGPGETAGFSDRRERPPAEARGLLVTFETGN